MSTNYGLILGAAQRVLGLIQAEPEVKDEGSINKVPHAPKTLVKFDDVYFTIPQVRMKQKTRRYLKAALFLLKQVKPLRLSALPVAERPPLHAFCSAFGMCRAEV